MPFDPSDFETRQLLDLSKPSLRALSVVLRDRALWPAGFRWNYTNCDTCAMGMATEMWRLKGAHTQAMQDEFHLPWKIASKFFLDASDYFDIYTGDVQPNHVADLIDAYLEGRT